MADFGALVWYLSYRHGVPLPNPAQDLYLFDGAKAAIESRITSADIRRQIAAMPIASELDPDVLDRLAASASSDQYKQGETISDEGSDHSLRLLQQGRARLVLRQHGFEDLAVLDLEAGDIMSVLAESSATDQATLNVAITDCTVITIPEEDAAVVLSLAHDLAAVLEQIGVTRRRRIQRILGRVQHADTESDPTSDKPTPTQGRRP
jgi:signal-transduction protein with cAMP-binding, CBS, and nucleotidyltransferase domain